jgi:hypothetical protein
MSDSPREACRKSSKGFEELFENSFPQAAREFAEKTIDQTREAYARSNRTLEAGCRLSRGLLMRLGRAPQR